MAKLGALGTFSQGKVSADDEGDLMLAVRADPAAGIVRIDFGKDVSWLGLDPATAKQFAMMIMARAEELPFYGSKA